MPFARMAALALLLVAGMAQAQLAQEPLLNRVNPVPPNLTLLMDDSGSMSQTVIYEHGKPDGLGPRGPGPGKKGDPDFGQNSPDVNRLHYDPRVRYQPRPDFNGSPLPLGPLKTTWSVYFRKTTGPYVHGQLTTAADYHTPEYVPPPHLVVSGSTASYPVDITSGTTITAFPKFVDRTDCTQNATACSLDEEKRNYTIWKTWYSTRLDMAKTGIALAFQPIKQDSIRIGFGTINDLARKNQMARGVAPYRAAPGDTKDKLYNWLYAINPTSTTPNIKAVVNAGKYHERTDSDGPWGSTPNPNSTGLDSVSSPSSNEPVAKHASCRRSFSVLVTDGYWNDSAADRKHGGDKKKAKEKWTIKSNDGSKKFDYEPKKPYTSKLKKAEDALSDAAMHFWGRDLRQDLDNLVPELTTQGGRNESFWQNVSFYAVTLGLKGTLSRDAATWNKLKDPTDDTVHWPDVNPGDPTTIDDTWHATVNGRGELLNANNASELTLAFKRMLQGMTGTPATLSGVAVSSAVAQSGLRKYKPEYLSGTWSGNLSAYLLDPYSGKELSPLWKVESGLDVNGDPKSTIPAAAKRKVVTWDGSASVDFDKASHSLNADLVAYLKGDTSKELRKAGGIFRNRESRLGDIVNSNPLFVRGLLDMKYEKLAGADAPPTGSYRSFVAAKAVRPGAVFVGANDGMLHGFADSDGAEIFAYVPQAVWPTLPSLAETPYEHRYFVDGPNVEADAYLNGNWTNLLLGTTGAGAKSVHAVDVTNPLLPRLLWEINSTRPGFSQLGHVLSGVHTGLLRTGEWVAVFGNGFGSSGGTARLFVVDLATGTLLKDMPVGAGVDNGLGAVTVVHDDKRRIIGAYAGDLHGTLWKFDLTPGFSGGSALYKPGSPTPRLAITAAPAVLPHPKVGHVVTFGTGKFFSEGDALAPYNTESLFGVWDAKPFGSPAVPVTGKTQLSPRSVTEVDVPPRKFFRISAGELSWGDGSSGVRGWYLDLPNEGQRLIYPVEPLAGSTFVMATTISPKDDTARDVCSQTGGGRGWSYIIDGVTGSGTTKPALDTNSDGVINGLDLVVSGYEHGVNGKPFQVVNSVSPWKSRGTAVSIGSTSHAVMCGQIGSGACPAARQWRQVFLR